MQCLHKRACRGAEGALGLEAPSKRSRSQLKQSRQPVSMPMGQLPCLQASHMHTNCCLCCCCCLLSDYSRSNCLCPAEQPSRQRYVGRIEVRVLYARQGGLQSCTIGTIQYADHRQRAGHQRPSLQRHEVL